MDENQCLASLLALPKETEWVEFKHNNDSPEEVGQYLSALANSAALSGEEAGFLVWGVQDETHQVLGTNINPRQRKIGNEEFENWLAYHLNPRVDFRFHDFEHDGKRVVMLRVQPAVGAPVTFSGVEWIRIGSIKKKLKDHPGRERDLWLALARVSFEAGAAATAVSGDEVLAMLDYPKVFGLFNQNLPANRSGILGKLAVERLVKLRGEDHFDITNLGAMLFAKDLGHFQGLSRKALRVIRYKGNNRTKTEHERVWREGYAAGFESILTHMNDLLPRNEVLYHF